jgi:hypothetical protein
MFETLSSSSIRTDHRWPVTCPILTCSVSICENALEIFIFSYLERRDGEAGANWLRGEDRAQPQVVTYLKA